MAGVTNTALMQELRAVRERVEGMVDAIALLCERVSKIEQWIEGHEANEHRHLWAEIARAQQQQEQQEVRLWELALRVAEIGAIVASVTKMAGMW